MNTMHKEAPSKIWINVGEISGDMHGASLMRALKTKRPEISIMGMGGPKMREDGFNCLFRAEELSVMGFTEVLGHLPKILRLLDKIEKKLKSEQPDAIVVIDAPDFHFRIIKIAKKLGIPVYYYISPKIWAWRQNRALFIKKNVRRLISILPFEADFYKKFGMEIDYVGNPLMDGIDIERLDQMQPVSGRIGFMPGSRKKEVSSLMAEFGEAARILQNMHPALEFQCAVAPGMTKEFLSSFWPNDIPLSYRASEERYDFMRSCQAIISASGTATLESALIGTPTVISYKMSPISFGLAKHFFIKIPYIGLANLISRREILPEVLQQAANGANLANIVATWLNLGEAPRGERYDEEIAPKMAGECGSIEKIKENLCELRKLVGGPGAAGRAAEIILKDLQSIEE